MRSVGCRGRRLSRRGFLYASSHVGHSRVPRGLYQQLRGFCCATGVCSGQQPARGWPQPLDGPRTGTVLCDRRRPVHVQLGGLHRPDANIEEFKTRYNIDEFTYDIYPSNEELLTRLQGGATGLYDVCAPTCEFVPTMADQDFIVPTGHDPDPERGLHQPDLPELLRSGRAAGEVQHVPDPQGLGHDRASHCAQRS